MPRPKPDTGKGTECTMPGLAQPGFSLPSSTRHRGGRRRAAKEKEGEVEDAEQTAKAL